MSNDLAEILESIRTTQANILARLNQIEQAQELAGSTELVVPGRWGYTSPTSPPSQRISVRQGYAWLHENNFEKLEPKTWPDFQPELPISAFADAYYYRAIIAWIDLNWWAPIDGFDVWESDTDFATYEECTRYLAEDLYFSGFLIDVSHIPLFPLCAIAVRNDGATGAINSYLPVTLTDRMQSSFILRDLRPWFHIDWWQ